MIYFILFYTHYIIFYAPTTVIFTIVCWTILILSIFYYYED